MLPIVFHPATIAAGLAGAGEALARRQAMLAQSGVTPRPVAPDAPLSGLTVLFVAGLEESASAALAGRARESGIPVNVEDRPELCDFHVPAALRRGELLFTVSTGGRAPGLSRLLREWLESRFDTQWSNHLDTLSRARADWRANGLPPPDISRKTRELVAEQGWLS